MKYYFKDQRKPSYKPQSIISGILLNVQKRELNSLALWIRWGFTAIRYNWFDERVLDLIASTFEYALDEFNHLPEEWFMKDAWEIRRLQRDMNDKS